MDLIHDMGYDIYIMDYTHLNVYACRILYPVYLIFTLWMSFIWRNNNEGAKFPLVDFLSLDQYDAEQWMEICDRLEEAGHSDIIRAAEFIGVVTDAGHALGIRCASAS